MLSYADRIMKAEAMKDNSFLDISLLTFGISYQENLRHRYCCGRRCTRGLLREGLGALGSW
eukprot:14332993-Heterocapsa_arctica.AAC.1